MNTSCFPTSGLAPPLRAKVVRHIEITRALAQKVLATIDVGLVRGIGMPEPGQMCVEAAVCYALGLPHGDDPGCVTDSLRILETRLNDVAWSSAKARAKGLRRLALAQLGSRGVLDERDLISRILRFAMTRQVPTALRMAAGFHTNPIHKAALDAAASECERDATLTTCNHARDVALAAYADTSRRDDPHAPAYAAHHAAQAAHCAALAAHMVQDESAFNSAACYIAGCASNVAFATRSRSALNESLAGFAEGVVQILIEMRSPGCEWLDLTQAA